jgi:acetoin utilization protein AcuB
MKGLPLNVIEMMTQNPVTIRVDDVLRTALEKMEFHQIHHLPVLSASRHLVGILSDRDCRLALNSPFVERAYWQNDVVETVTVRQVMTPAPITVSPDTTAYEATRLMLTHRVGCLPVMNDETLVGILTRSDLLIAAISVQRHYEKLLQNGSQDAD